MTAGARLALALDCDNLAAARSLASRLRVFFPVVKVGLELFSAAGGPAVEVLAADGFEVFLDVKLHDIPTTVGKAARVLGRLGARYVTVHAAGGAVMLAAAVEGLAAGADEAGVGRPGALAVTVLTSEPHADAAVVAERAGFAAASRCEGVVCAAGDLPVVRAAAPGLLAVVPGIRPAGGPVHDQGRAATPEVAVAAGAGLLVVGRAVTADGDPEAAAARLVAAVAGARPVSGGPASAG